MGEEIIMVSPFYVTNVKGKTLDLDNETESYPHKFNIDVWVNYKKKILFIKLQYIR